MTYPNRVLRSGVHLPDAIRAVQARLNELGIRDDDGTPVDVDGIYGEDTQAAVMLFQSRFTEPDGDALTIDGEVGMMTWSALFDAPTTAITPPTVGDLATLQAADLLRLKALDIATAQIGVRESPLGSNSGPEVDRFLASVGLKPGAPWCMAFIYFCFVEAAKVFNIPNPLVRTGGCLDHWHRADGRPGARRITREEALDDPTLVKPGHIFIMDFGRGRGHTGIVEANKGGKLTTVEGNSNDGGSREGIGVFRLDRRRISQMKGFLNYRGGGE